MRIWWQMWGMMAGCEGGLGSGFCQQKQAQMRGKQKKKEQKQSKKRQLLTVFRQTVPLLQLLTQEETDSLEDLLHIFVFTRGQCIAKEGEPVDYIGSIAEGRAVGKGKPYEAGDLIGHAALLGYQQRHPRTITAESDGVIIAVRILDLLAIEKHSLKNRILTFMVEVHAGEIASREGLGKSYEQFETVQEKKISKYFSAEWASFFSGEMDAKEKAKFTSYFPFYRIKQKDLISNQSLKPALIYLVQGQLIAKNKQEQRIIQSGGTFNLEGFIFGHPSADNLYCLSTEAIVLVVDRGLLESSFKFQTHRGLMRLALGQLSALHKKEMPQGQQQGREGKSWSMFKKYPNAEILPLPKKPDNIKNASKNNNSQSELASLAVFQTLFREQLGSNKEKTSASLAESGYDKLYTLKTQSAGKEVQAALQLQKLRKEVELLSEKLRFSQEMGKLSKLQLIQNRARVSMGPVLKQIRRLHQQDESIRGGTQKEQDSQGGQSALTLKQALAKQYKESKVQMLVAKCAFRWLYITRKRRAARTSE